MNLADLNKISKTQDDIKKQDNSEKNAKPKKGIFKKMYNFITRNKSDDEEDKKKKEEKRMIINNYSANVNLEKIEKELEEKDIENNLKEMNNQLTLSKSIITSPVKNEHELQEKVDEKKKCINESKFNNIQEINQTKKDVKLEIKINNPEEINLSNSAKTNSIKTPKDFSIPNLQFNIDNIDGNYQGKIKTKDMKLIEISNCWNLLENNPENIEDIFYNNLILKDEFYKDPWRILNNVNLVIRYEENLYTWKAAAPLLISILAFGEVPNQTVMQPLLAHNERGFMSYFKRSKPNKVDLLKIDLNKGRKTPKTNFALNEAVNSTEIIKELEKIEKKIETINEPPVFPTISNSNRRISLTYKKSLTPTSDQLKKLGLKKGRNEIRFSVTSRYQGTHSQVTDMYLWESDSKIVISDVDGTITRSDILGQLMPIFGKDWSHTGVTELFKNIEKNNYKIMYLTARAIGQSQQTKGYLTSLSQSNNYLIKRGNTSPKGSYFNESRWDRLLI